MARENERLLKEWQNRLGLQNWTIKLEDMCRPEDMVLEEVSGCTEWEESIRSAKIQILDPMFYGNRIIPFDFEQALVHELLHIKTCLLTSKVDDLQERVGHIMIDDLARAFVDAKRSGKSD